MSLIQKAKLASRALFDERYRYLFRQRSITDGTIRDVRASEIARALPPVTLPDTPAGRELCDRGIYFLDNLITPDQVAQMREWFTDAPAEDPHRKHLGTFVAPEQTPAESHVAYILQEHVASAPHALEFANHPQVLEAVTQYLGAKPTISYMTAWWSLPRLDEPEGPENFHRDWDDFRFVKLFLYLTDVDADSGPHAFVAGSHRSPKLMERRRFTDAEVEAAFAAKDRMIITGPAGSHFLETTFGVHRGIPPTKRRRLIFQVLYSLNAHISGPRNAILTLDDKTAQGLDAYTNRIYCRFSS